MCLSFVLCRDLQAVRTKCSLCFLAILKFYRYLQTVVKVLPTNTNYPCKLYQLAHMYFITKSKTEKQYI